MTPVITVPANDLLNILGTDTLVSIPVKYFVALIMLAMLLLPAFVIWIADCIFECIEHHRYVKNRERELELINRYRVELEKEVHKDA